MTEYETIRIEYSTDNIATVTLSRPDVRNAINATLIGEVTEAFGTLGQDARIRAIVLRGEGKVFCAGADLNWMRDTGNQTEAETREDSRRLQTMYHTVDQCPKPVIAAVHGAVMAGALGLICGSDVVIAQDGTKFSVSEVKLGLIPAVISSFLLPRIGFSHMRYLATTAAVVDTQYAERIGLVHRVVADREALDVCVAEHVGMALNVATEAVATCKELLRDIGAGPLASHNEKTLDWNAKARRSPVAQEGMKAFLERRPAAWVPTANKK